MACIIKFTRMGCVKKFISPLKPQPLLSLNPSAHRSRISQFKTPYIIMKIALISTLIKS